MDIFNCLYEQALLVLFSASFLQLDISPAPCHQLSLCLPFDFSCLIFCLLALSRSKPNYTFTACNATYLLQKRRSKVSGTFLAVATSSDESERIRTYFSLRSDTHQWKPALHPVTMSLPVCITSRNSRSTDCVPKLSFQISNGNEGLTFARKVSDEKVLRRCCLDGKREQQPRTLNTKEIDADWRPVTSVYAFMEWVSLVLCSVYSTEERKNCGSHA